MSDSTDTVIHGWVIPYTISVTRDQTSRGVDHLSKNGQRVIQACMNADSAAMVKQMLQSRFSMFILG